MKLARHGALVMLVVAIAAPAMAQTMAWEQTEITAMPGETVTAWLQLTQVTSNWNRNWQGVTWWYSDAGLTESGAWIWQDDTHESRFIEVADRNGVLNTVGGAAWWGGNTKWYIPWGYTINPQVGEWMVGIQFTIPVGTALGSTLQIGWEAAFGMSPNVPTYFDNIYQYERDEIGDPGALTIQIGMPPTPGDVDEDTDVDADDIDMMGDHIRTSTPPTAANYDLTGFDEFGNPDPEGGYPDGAIDILDLDYLIRFLVETTVGTGTEYGDFNLDGLVDTTDLTRLATNYGPGTMWAEGNANRNFDMLIDTTDLTILSTYFGFDATVDAIPEPMTLSLLAVGACLPLFRRKRR